MYMPIYACDKLFLVDGKTAPYIDISIGGYVNLYSKIVSGTKETKYDGKGGGFFMRTGLGLKINGMIHFGVGYQLMFQDKVDYANHSAYFKIGI